MALVAEVHIVDLSGDWWGISEGGAERLAEGGSSLGRVDGSEDDGGLVSSLGGGASGSVKSVWRERSHRTTSEGQEGPWPGRAWARVPGSRRERKAREPMEQNV